MEKKLTINHLAPYLPYGLELDIQVESMPAFKFSRKLELDCGHDFHLHLANGDIKPILRPIDLTKEITHKGETFVPMQRLNDITALGDTEIRLLSELSWDWYFLPFWIVEKLHEWMFDLDGLIESGLAISVNTLEVNPYQ